MGEVIQLQGDQRKDVQEFLTDKKEGLELDAKTIKVCSSNSSKSRPTNLLFPHRFMAFKPIESRPTSHHPSELRQKYASEHKLFSASCLAPSSDDDWVDVIVFTVLGRYGAFFDNTRILS